MKPKIAIYDFTDCEGCESQLISLLDRFLELEERIDIVNWRLGQEDNDPGPFDICLIEGTPITGYEQKLLRDLRKRSKFLIALGACAATGGIPAIISQSQRKRLYKKIYGKEYQPKGIDSLPLSAYIKVDFMLPGCPVGRDDIVRTLTDLLAGKAPQPKTFPVCLECKAAGNRCRLLERQPCLGPITQGGCKAVCVTGGTGCYGCRGAVQNANLAFLKNRLKEFMTAQEIKSFVSVFLKATDGYKKLTKK
jgi:coenzyme F420-reducing hydrogenase gamma subunit